MFSDLSVILSNLLSPPLLAVYKQNQAVPIITSEVNVFAVFFMTVSEELTKRTVSVLFHYVKGLSTAAVFVTYSDRPLLNGIEHSSNCVPQFRTLYCCFTRVH